VNFYMSFMSSVIGVINEKCEDLIGRHKEF